MNDLEFLKNPFKWPHLFVPLRRQIDAPFPYEHGIYFGQSDQGKEIVTVLNMWEGWTPKEFDAAKKYEYNSLEELLKDGWQVD